MDAAPMDVQQQQIPENPLEAPPSGPPEERFASQIASGNAFDDKRLRVNDVLLLARFSQTEETHNLLGIHLLMDDSLVNIFHILNNPFCTTYYDRYGTPRRVGTDVPFLTNPVELFSKNIRFASYYIELKHSGSGRYSPIVDAYVINTIPVKNFYVIDLLKVPTEFVKYSQPGGVFDTLLYKILYELKVLSYQLDGLGRDSLEKPYKLLINFDIYYNRSRDLAGAFHRDISTGLGNNPIYVSLEFFGENKDAIFFGPEVFCHTTETESIEVQMERYSDIDLRNEVLRRREENSPFSKSLRLLCKPQTTIIFNNHLAIHASPITDPYLAFHQGRETDVLGTPFHDESQRLETTAPAHQVVETTRTVRRTFLRTWISSGEGFTLDRPNSRRLEGFGLLQRIAETPDIAFSVITQEILFGGAIVDGQDETIKTSTLKEPTIESPMFLKSETGLKDIVTDKINKTDSTDSTELDNFKIVGNPLNSRVQINLDVPFEEITGDENIEKYKLKEISFIKEIINKKGGNKKIRKNRKNIKTKKIRKAIKSNKYNKHRKTKKTAKNNKHKKTKSKRNKRSRK